MKFDDVIRRYLGEFGQYQKILFAFVCAPCIIAAMHALSWTFSAADLPHRCRTEYEPKNASYWLLNSTGFELATENCIFDQRCYKKCLYNNYGCTKGYIYDYKEIQKSAINKWDLVCESAWVKAFVQSTYYIGQAIGAILFGFTADRYGRKKVVLTAIVTVSVASFGMAKPFYWPIYAIWRTLAGIAHPGLTTISFLIGTELVGPSGRRFGSLLSGIYFTVGHIILGSLAYFIRDFEWLQLSIAIFSFVIISYYWKVPESPRWLVSQQRYEEADRILQHVAACNKKEIPNNWWIEVHDALDDKKVYTYHFFHLLKTPKLRRRSLAMFLVWPVVSMVYYGVSMNTTFMGGNLYLTFILGALVELPAVWTMYLLIDVIGRKLLVCLGCLICTGALLASFVIDNRSATAIQIIQFLITKSAISLTINSLYTFTPELFPTVLRATASLGCSMMARIGATTSSFIMMWLINYSKLFVIIPFSILTFVSAIVAWVFLPETMGQKLPETIDDVEAESTK